MRGVKVIPEYPLGPIETVAVKIKGRPEQGVLFINKPEYDARRHILVNLDAPEIKAEMRLAEARQEAEVLRREAVEADIKAVEAERRVIRATAKLARLKPIMDSVH